MICTIAISRYRVLISLLSFSFPFEPSSDNLLQVAEVQGWLTRADLENSWAGNDIAICDNTLGVGLGEKDVGLTERGFWNGSVVVASLAVLSSLDGLDIETRDEGQPSSGWDCGFGGEGSDVGLADLWEGSDFSG